MESVPIKKKKKRKKKKKTDAFLSRSFAEKRNGVPFLFLSKKGKRKTKKRERVPFIVSSTGTSILHAFNLYTVVKPSHNERDRTTMTGD